MNYIEFQIGGKLRGFKFGLGFLGEIQNHFDTEIEGIGRLVNKNPILFIPAMLYFGHKHQCIRKGTPITFELYDFEDWITELEKGITNPNIYSCINAMNVGIEHVMGVTEGESKVEESAQGEKKN